MSTWKRLAVTQFPEHRFGPSGFQKPAMTLYQIFFTLSADIKKHQASDNKDGIERIFKYVEWCFAQRNHSPNIWNAAACAFVEHLADNDETTQLIIDYVNPEIFKYMWDEFEKRRERKGMGKARELWIQYDAKNKLELQ